MKRHARVARLRVPLVALAALLLLAIAASAPSAAPTYTGWSAPVNLGAAINTSASEGGPALTADGLSLYFHSGRPGGFGSRDLWVAHRATLDAAWGTPVNLGPTINSAAGQEAPALTPDGHWLFYADNNRPGGFGDNDIWASWRPNTADDLGWQTPVNLGPTINTSSSDYGPSYVEGDGGAPKLYFGSQRPGGAGMSDIYVSERQADGSWAPPTRVPELGDVANDTRPTVRHDGLEIYIQTDRAGGSGLTDVWGATRPSTGAPWSTPVNLGPVANSATSEFAPFLTADGRSLLFSSSRAGGFGNTDLYVMTRAAELTVTANDQLRLFGQANPALTYELSGFVGGETASVVSGTASCSTTATPASPAGEYPITCSVGSLSAPGYTFASFVAGTLKVEYSRPCSTGPSAGPLHVAAGEAICIGGAHTGPVTVAPGGSLDVEGGRITGSVVANGAAAARICGATITGPLTITGSTGPVLVGGEGCAPNTVVGPVRVTDNTGGVEVSGNRVVGPLRVTGNSAPVHAAGNTVTGPATIQS
jgi:Tol biopolymer transport system component